MRRPLAIIAAIPVLVASAAAHADGVRNVILMIGDGMGFNHVTVGDYYAGTPAVYHSFPVQLGVSTYSASNPSGYSPSQCATSFSYASGGYTDSSAAASAMFSGVKILNDKVNMSTSGKPLTTFFQYAASASFDKSMGAVSTYHVSHATPAAVYGHNTSRNNYSELANEGIYGANPNSHNANYNAQNYNGNFTVLMGAGNGDYNNNGVYTTSASDTYIGGSATWTDIKNGAPNGWTLVEQKSQFEAIAAGTNVPAKLLGIAQVNQTLQYNRSGSAPLTNVPSLATMTKAALNVLNQNPNGFTVMIEGGNIDSAAHAGNTLRMIEEQRDFSISVQTAVDWVEANSNWEETLLIVTADHETGYLMGSSGSSGYFDRNHDHTYNNGTDWGYIVNNGAGNLPGVKWSSGNHTNTLVPLFARGAGSELFYEYLAGTDPNLASYYNLTGSTWTGAASVNPSFLTGAYIDNTSIHHVMVDSLTYSVPEPASLAVLALGGLALLRRRR